MEAWNVNDARTANQINNNSPDDNNEENNPQKKKRKRISHTCTSCKSRKVKCDQGKPCSSCVRKRIPAHLCIYEESPFIPTIEHAKDLNEVILLLKQENKRLKREVEQYKRYSAPSSDSSASPNEKMTRLTESLTLRADRTSYNGSTSWRSLLDSDITNKDIIESAKKYVTNARKEWNIERNLKNAEFGDYDDIEASSPNDLLLKLKSFLPDYEALEEYLEIFLNSYWYHTIKIVDPAELIKDFHQLFVRDFYNNTYKIVITNKVLDYGKLAVILLCLKFVILTLNSIYVESNTDSKDHLCRYTEKLLDYSNFFAKPTIPALQALVLLTEVKRINPSENDGGDGSNVSLLFKTTINMAILMGLNRNIDELYSHEIDRVKTKLKAIWRYLFKRDALISFYIGAPLSIEDSYVDHSAIRFGNLQDDLVLIIREANRLLSRVGHCKQKDILRVIHKLETYNDGALVKFASTVRDAQTVEKFMSSFDDVASMEDKISAIYALHVLYEILLVGSENDDEGKDSFYNGDLKYGLLAVTHLIELLLRLNSWCKKIAKDVGTGDKARLYNIAEISTSFTALSRIILLKTHCALCQYIVHSLLAPQKDDAQVISTSEPLSLSVDEIENLDIHDSTRNLNKMFREPHFLYGLITLACKYMLHLNNTSFGKVFSMSFCLHAVIALYKYFNAVLQKNLDPEQLEAVTGTKPRVRYYTNEKVDPAVEKDGDLLKDPNYVPHLTKPYFRLSLDKLLDSTPQISATPASTSNGPASASASTSSQDQELANFDFFDWKNETIDELFDSLLTDDSLFNFDERNQQLHIMFSNESSLAANLKGIYKPQSKSGEL